MPTPFSRCARALDADSSRRTVSLILMMAALLCAWLVWFAMSNVAVYETTDAARRLCCKKYFDHIL